MMRLAARLPEIVKRPLREMARVGVSIAYTGTRLYCPVCGRTARAFRVYRNMRRCPHCGSLGRHRMVWLLFERRTDLFDGRAKRVLHVAPEPCLADRLRSRIGEGYVSTDLMDARAMEEMDITDIQYPDGTFDVIYCSHVLEHVPDDRKAMREFRRVLKDDGWAVLLVPITAGETFEDASVVTPEDRLRVFGQEDHVRRYGPDYVDRLAECGWAVEATRPEELAEGDDMERMLLQGTMFMCRKKE